MLSSNATLVPCLLQWLGNQGDCSHQIFIQFCDCVELQCHMRWPLCNSIDVDELDAWNRRQGGDVFGFKLLSIESYTFASTRRFCISKAVGVSSWKEILS